MALDLLPISVTWLVLAILPVLFYMYVVRPMQVFTKMGVPGPTPLPVVGNVLWTLRMGLWNPDYQRERVERYGGVYGIFLGTLPILFVTDPELIREVFVKKFSSFTNRTVEERQRKTTPSSLMLISLRDEGWKKMRSTLSPAFSSGKLKMMTEGMSACADKLVQNIAKSEGTGESFEAKEVAGAFTMDVIARTAFGTEIDSQQNPQDPFVVNGKKAVDGAFSWASPIGLLNLLFPKLMKPILEMINYDHLVRRSVNSFFCGVFDQLMAIRRTDGKGRVDFMQLMVDAHKEENEEAEGMANQHDRKRALTRDDVVANGVLFFLAGYETTATTMSFVMYNLALNQLAQDRARKEINKIMENRDLVDYEAVQQMSYLDMCIMETLRLYPPVTLVARTAAEDVTLKGLTIPKDMMVQAAVLAIHYDPARWPEPKKFIPERFTKEEREKRDPYDWLPFGAGPRNCIGMRLAMVELKVGLAKVLMKYRIVTGPDTDVPLVMKKNQSIPTPENGIRLKVELIE